ncbi:TlpA family protein disulfide reductase [Acinetobacter sp.]|uniref:TlpA family protein disulfide reductase n=1 Tax=Acinetobacter sp. TaxID=472 RepID=UPI00388E4C5A
MNTQQRLQTIGQMPDVFVKDSLYTSLLKSNKQLNLGVHNLTMVLEFAKIGNKEKVEQYLNQIEYAKDPKGKAIQAMQIYPIMIQNLIRHDTKIALPYITTYIEYTRAQLPENKKIWSAAAGKYYNALLAYFDVFIQDKQYEQAYNYNNLLQLELSKYENVDQGLYAKLKQNYLVSLLNTKRYKQAFPLLEASFQNENRIPGIVNHLKLAYAANYDSLEGYEAYLKKLEQKKNDFVLKQTLNAAIKLPAPNFTLADVDGKLVRLSDLKGKVVILDFWATWCEPCKASFPTMQKAVNKYKDDKDVKFLFLHTWEKGGVDATKDAKQYVVDHNYSFEVLMDLRNVDTKKSAVAEAYKVSGIPTKIFIDPQGMMRFITTGFSSDEGKALQEISTMIDFVKKSK